MYAKKLVVIADRGGHLHDALRLIDQMGLFPEALVTTVGPDVNGLVRERNLKETQIFSIPLMFTWVGKKRLFNPIKMGLQVLLSFLFCVRLRPKWVVSTGASDVVFFCYFAKIFGATIYHIENLAQVESKSVTAKLLYPICSKVFVQWKELLPLFGPKAEYAGWVL